MARSFSLNLLKWLARSTNPANVYETKADNQSCLLGSTKDNHLRRMYIGYHPAPFSKDDWLIVQQAFDVVGTAANECRNKGIEFLLVYAPTKFRVYNHLCQWEEGSTCETWTCNNMPERMESWALQQDISFLNLTPHLKEAAQNGEQMYELEDTHWTPAGHGVAAKHTAEFIQNSSWLSDRS